jgi:hypothetical protein
MERARWVRGTVRELLHNRAYLGEKGYERIIDPERFDRIHTNLARSDPAQVAKRQGGRKPKDDSYFLRGVGFCRSCGEKLYNVDVEPGPGLPAAADRRP